MTSTTTPLTLPQPAKSPAPITLHGRTVTLSPLDVGRDGAKLYAELKKDDSVWDYMAYEPFATEAEFLEWLATRAPLTDPLHFALIPTGAQSAQGWATLMEIRPIHGVIEIGHIMFARAIQRSPITSEAIFLLLQYAFDTLGYRRVEWKTNSLNTPSRNAALRFGFTFEGIFRQHMIVKGKNRDTAWFSMLDSEWPHVKEAFTAWLAADNFDAHGQQKKALRDFMARR